MGKCIFCEIASKDSVQTEILRDKSVAVLLDIYPKEPAHCLVIPRKHSSDIFDLEEDSAMAVMKMTLKIAHAIKEAFNPEGMNIRQNSGSIAGQSIFHFHMHIIPRYVDPDFHNKNDFEWFKIKILENLK